MVSIQGVLEDVLAAHVVLLLGIVGGLAMGLLARIKNHYSLPVSILVAMGFVALLLFTMNQLRALFRNEPERAVSLATPPEKLEETIRKWLDDLSFKVQKNKGDEESVFSFTVQGISGIPVRVVRYKRTAEQYVVFMGFVPISSEGQKKLNSLPERHREWIRNEVAMELRRQRVASEIDLPNRVVVQVLVPISELTQAKLLNGLTEVDSMVGLTIMKLRALVE